MTKFRLSGGALTISFVGLDGSGKGTYLSLLSEEYLRKGILFKRCYFGFSSFRMLGMKAVVRLKKKCQGHVWYKLIAGFYLLLLPFEFLIRRGMGSYQVLLTDRHPRYEPIFESGPLVPYNGLLDAICPSPDVVIYLTGDAEILWKRKKEYNFQRYIERASALDEMVRQDAGRTTIIKVDTEGEIRDVFEKIQTELAKC